jgi:hypothetical protein
VLPVEAGHALRALLDADADLPIIDGKHAAAHRRLLSRWIQFHAGESPDLTALAFWLELQRTENGNGRRGTDA